MNDNWLNKVNWAQDGLVPAVTQDAASGRVLTVAWMNREALQQTAHTGEAHLRASLRAPTNESAAADRPSSASAEVSAPPHAAAQASSASPQPKFE